MLNPLDSRLFRISTPQKVPSGDRIARGHFLPGRHYANSHCGNDASQVLPRKVRSERTRPRACGRALIFVELRRRQLRRTERNDGFGIA